MEMTQWLYLRDISVDFDKNSSLDGLSITDRRRSFSPDRSLEDFLDDSSSESGENTTLEESKRDSGSS